MAIRSAGGVSPLFRTAVEEEPGSSWKWRERQSALNLASTQDGSILDAHLWTASLLDANGEIIGTWDLADITAEAD
jgi:hypothetical protein